MDSEATSPAKTLTKRHKCAACHKQFKVKEHLVEHMKISFHSSHQPKCGVCHKHCKSFQSLREHLTGPLAKSACSIIFADRGCALCLEILCDSSSRDKHMESCCLSAPSSVGIDIMKSTMTDNDGFKFNDGKSIRSVELEPVAIDCEMVGGGIDGKMELCARVCVVDKAENILLYTYVQPAVSVTDYRYEVTGITEEHLRDAMPLNEVREKILQILYNSENAETLSSLAGGKSKVVVGHNLQSDLDSLRIVYPTHLWRDTSKYIPLMKTNLVSHSLKYLTKTYLGYDIQSGKHDPLEDCVSAMRLYNRMRDQDHFVKGTSTLKNSTGFDSWKMEELENMTPEELYQISKSNYKCWCLDSYSGMQQLDR